MTKRIFHTVVVILFGCFIFLIYSYSIGYNINSNNAYYKKLAISFVPQGWGFFTSNPKEKDQITLYDRHMNKLIWKNAHYKNLFGLSKKSRKLSMEASIIMAKIDDSLWLNKNRVDLNNIKWHQISNENLYYLKEGKFVLERYKMPPYLWREISDIEGQKEIIYVQTTDKNY